MFESGSGKGEKGQFSTFYVNPNSLIEIKNKNLPQFDLIKNCFIEIRGDSCNLIVPNSKVRDGIKRETLEALAEVAGREITDVIIDPSIFPEEGERKGIFLFGYDVLHREFSFENFVVGRFNEDAYSFAKGAVEGRVNIVSVFSAPGLGKTHLLEASGKKMVSRGKKVSFFTSDMLVESVIKASSQGKLNKLLNMVEESDAVIIDDIQNIRGDMVEVQEFLFNLFNRVTVKGGVFMVSSDTNPRLLPLDKRLTQRFTSGCVASISIPDYADKKKILVSMARRKGVEVDEEFVELISKSPLGEDLRQLENAINTYEFLKSINPDISPRDVFTKLLLSFDKYGEAFNILDKAVFDITSAFGIPFGMLFDKRLKKGVGAVRSFCIYVGSLMGIGNLVLSEYFKIPRDRVRKEIFRGKKLAETDETYERLLDRLKAKFGF